MKKKVMKWAVNYNKIVNFNYEESDFITKLLIEYYMDKALCLSTSNLGKSIDNIMLYYINEKKFRKYVSFYIRNNNYSDITSILNKCYYNYRIKDYEERKSAKWI